jgi:dihydropteroate synthase
MSAGVAVTALARTLGARIFRVHDIPVHLAALRMAEELLTV